MNLTKKEKSATYRKENKEKIATYSATYYKENKEKKAARRAAYNKENKEKTAALQAACYKKNKEKIVAYREENKEKFTAYRAMRINEITDSYVIGHIRTYLKRYNIDGQVTPEMITLKREQIKIFRELNKLKEVINDG